MEPHGIILKVLPGYQLLLHFPNGSEAIVDMKQRVRGLRFGKLASRELFASARLVDSEVVWDDGQTCIRASINELLDSMQMD